jgi:PAS domain S-box-containing protein
MSWITIVWSMNAAACLTLGAIYLVVWCKQRENWVHLLFSCSAVAAAAVAGFELAMLHADTVGQYEALVRWIHVPVWVLTLSFVAFVRRYLHAGRPWLAWSIYGLRTVVLILNFILTPNINFLAITSIRHLSLWGGEIVSLPIGVPNPWNLLSLASLLLLLLFSVDATITVWRRGDRRRALVVGGSMIFGTIVACHVPLVIWGIINVPFFLCFAYSGIVLAMGFELSNDMLQTAQLAQQLEASEADLRDSKERIDLANKAAGLIVWTWDIRRDEVWLSEKDRALLGFSQSQKLTAERVRNVVYPEDRQFLRQLVEHSLTTPEEVEGEYRIVLADGSVRWVTRRGRVEFNGNGQPAWERGVLMDITERKQAEEQFRLVVEAAPSAMIMVNTEGCITLVNTQAEAVFGYSRHELIGRPVEMLVPEQFRSQHVGDRHGYLAEAHARPMGAGRELFGRRKDGSQVPVEIGLNPIHTPEGLFVLASIIDISERKQAELEAARQRNELAHLSRVTTLGELSGSIAHELNLPLTAILSNAQAAQRVLANGKADLAEMGEILNEIVSEDKRAGEVIRRLRLFLKKHEVQQHAVNINQVVDDVLQLIRSDFVNHKVTVDTELARNLPDITGDPVQLQQVLLNLLVNACDAMCDCSVAERRLLIRTGVENGSSAVIVSVTDRGNSIQEEKMEEIFEPFFTTKTKGMGLGLSVCRTIIAAHRGKLWATNNPDRGATFHFSLPIAATNKETATSNTTHATSMQCCSHGAVRCSGGVDPNGITRHRGVATT